MVYPAAVYLSYPTEYGTVYSKKELYGIANVCREKGLLLYLDGARLGYGLAIPDTDVTLADIAKVCEWRDKGRSSLRRGHRISQRKRPQMFYDLYSPTGWSAGEGKTAWRAVRCIVYGRYLYLDLQTGHPLRGRSARSLPTKGISFLC